MSEKVETGGDLEPSVETTIMEELESEPPDAVEDLRKQIAELKVESDAKDKRLHEKEKLLHSSMKMIEKTAEDYKVQIKCLKDQLAKGCSNDKQLAKENDKLKKNNSTLLKTNKHLTKQVQDLQREDDHNSQSDSSELANTKFALEETGKELAELRNFAHQLQLNVSKLNREKSTLINDLVKDKKSVKDLNDKLSELTDQMKAVVAERDELVSQAQGSTTHVEQNPAGANDASAEIENLRNQIVHLIKEIDQQKRLLENKDDHIKEQEAKIEKLVLRCAEAEDEPSSSNQSPTKSGAPPPEEVERMQSQINALQDVNKFYAQQNSELDKENKKLKCELELLKSQSSPDVIAVQEQMKAFQDDFFYEREEKKRIIEQSKLLEEENMRLRASRQQSADSLHLSPPPVSQSSMTHQSPPIVNQPFAFAPSQGPRMPGQGTIPHTGQGVYQASYNYSNSIPPDRRDYSQHQGRHDDRHASQYARGGFYGYPPEQRGQYYTGHQPEMSLRQNYPHPLSNTGPSGRPRAPSQGQQNRSQPPKRK